MLITAQLKDNFQQKKIVCGHFEHMMYAQSKITIQKINNKTALIRAKNKQISLPRQVRKMRTVRLVYKDAAFPYWEPRLSTSLAQTTISLQLCVQFY